MKDKATAAILAFFLGGLGIHRFYLNQAGLGIIYLLFCWTFIPVLISLVDFIAFLAMSKDEFDSKYNRNVQAAPAQAAQPTTVVHESTGSTADELEKLHSLLEKGAITQEEYDTKKKELL